MAKVAFVLGPDFEDSEFKVPYDRIRAAGHDVTVIGTKAGEQVTGKRGKERFTPEVGPRDVDAGDFDALVIPGGYSPDKLRVDDGIVSFVRKMGDQGRVVAAICHAGSLLIEADVLEGRTVTSWPSIRTDLINAGADWVDRQVAIDDNFITSRKPDDLEAFSAAILERL